MKRKKTPRYMRGDGRGKGKAAFWIFAVVAVLCEIVLIRGARGSGHPVMTGVMIGVITIVLIAFGAAIRYINRAAEANRGDGKAPGAEEAPAADTETTKKSDSHR